MGHDLDLLLTLTGALTAALLFGYLTHRLRLSPIVGYLLAGIAIGPFTPGFVAHGGLANQFAELGVILLMFGVGLQFHLEELLAVRKVALPGAILGMASGGAAGFALAKALQWNGTAAAIFGMAVATTSTVVLLRVLSDKDMLQAPAGRIGIGWLVVEDLLAVGALVIIPVVAQPAAGEAGARGMVVALGIALLKLAALLLIAWFAGGKFVPLALHFVAKTKSRELFTLTVLVLALGIALGSARFFGASMALGAFIAGMIVGRSQFSARAAAEALPMRDAFAVLFFVSVGMLFDPKALMGNVVPCAIAVAVVLAVKPLVAFLVLKVGRHETRTALPLALSLGQIGEFSFILATLGRSMNVFPEQATQVLVATSIVTITASPLMVGLANPIAKALGERAAAGRKPEDPAPSDEGGDPRHRAVVIGYGPVGRSVTKLLLENGITPTVIELNHETTQTLTDQGVRAVYGDASQPGILERAGIRRAATLIFAASGTPADLVVRTAKELNPNLQIFARASYIREVDAVRSAGANVVVVSEVELAMAMAEHLLTRLGATSEQLDRARERIRDGDLSD
ncbi:MAG: cation:proton antiporter [Polyangiaceae bacterium]